MICFNKPTQFFNHSQLIRALIEKYSHHRVAATHVIIGHNHPSGNLTPSRQDEELTAKIKEACSVMDIQLTDHIILSPVEERYLSFADEGLL